MGKYEYYDELEEEAFREVVEPKKKPKKQKKQHIWFLEKKGTRKTYAQTKETTKETKTTNKNTTTHNLKTKQTQPETA